MADYSKRTELALLRRLPDPMMTHRWIIDGDLPFGKEFGVNHSFIESVNVPFNNLTASNAFYGGGYNYFPQFHDISAFTLNVYADGEGRALEWLLYWKSCVKDFNTGLYKLPYGKDGYKRDLPVTLLDAAGRAICTITLKDTFPVDLGNLDLNYSSADRLVLSQNFSVDTQVVQFTHLKQRRRK